MTIFLPLVRHAGSLAPEPLNDSLFATVVEILRHEAELFCHGLHLFLAAHRGSRAPLLSLAGDLTANAVLVSATFSGPLDLGLNLCEPFLLGLLLLPPPRIGGLLPLSIFLLVHVGSGAFSFDTE